ncbi:hypothetical protein [Thalassospira profundimaris]|uniref:hypothetical protein n=1 Tax=Thalassospira profundimaris TaxID=502049 RepID=UPI0011BF8EFA|nr:hypothetical protein [Thalassospira profundimaris]
MSVFKKHRGKWCSATHMGWVSQIACQIGAMGRTTFFAVGYVGTQGRIRLVLGARMGINFARMTIFFRKCFLFFRVLPVFPGWPVGSVMPFMFVTVIMVVAGHFDPCAAIGLVPGVFNQAAF